MKEIVTSKASITLILKEIPTKGKIYVIVNDSSQDNVHDIMSAIETDIKMAEHIFISFKTNEEINSKDYFEINNYKFRHSHYMHKLVCDLTKDHVKIHDDQISFEQLSQENQDVYKRINNTCFKNVPNSETLDDDNIKDMLNVDSFYCSIIQIDGISAGNIELSYLHEFPEISAICLLSEYHNKGFGRRLIKLINQMFLDEGHSKSSLTVATSNKNAYHLYESEGFKFDKIVSKWYKVELKP